MDRFPGKLFNIDGELLCEADFNIGQSEQAGLKRWIGWFNVAEGGPRVTPGRYEMKLDDGRECTITVRRVKPSLYGTHKVAFIINSYG